jgi:hypothetical protein
MFSITYNKFRQLSFKKREYFLVVFENDKSLVVPIENQFDYVLFRHFGQLSGKYVLQIYKILHVFLCPFILFIYLSFVMIVYWISPWVSAKRMLSSLYVKPTPVLYYYYFLPHCWILQIMAIMLPLFINTFYLKLTFVYFVWILFNKLNIILILS